MDEEIVELMGDASLFTPDHQAKYLLRLLNGDGDRVAAREIGFLPKMVLEYRKSNPIFEEECQEALAEYEEHIKMSVAQAAERGEPWAGRGYQAKWGWTDKKDGDKTQVNVFSNVELTGNPIERLLAMQNEIVTRPEIEEAPKVIDVTIEDEDTVS